MISLLRYAKKYRLQMVIGPFFKFVEAVFELFLPLLMAKLIDNGINKGDTAYIYKMGGLIFGNVGYWLNFRFYLSIFRFDCFTRFWD